MKQYQESTTTTSLSCKMCYLWIERNNHVNCFIFTHGVETRNVPFALHSWEGLYATTSENIAKLESMCIIHAMLLNPFLFKSIITNVAFTCLIYD